MKTSSALFWGRFLGVSFNRNGFRISDVFPAKIFRLEGAVLWERGLDALPPLNTSRPVTIRKIDHPEVSRLRWHADVKPPGQQLFTGFPYPVECFIALAGDEVVHVHFALHRRPVPRLFGGNTAAAFRGMGIASAVTLEICRRLKERGYAAVSASTDIRNVVSNRMLLSLSFRPIRMSYIPRVFNIDWSRGVRRR